MDARDVLTVRRVVDGRVYTRKVSRGATLSTDETLRVLGISLRRLRYLVARGNLRPRKVRGRLRFVLDGALRIRREKGGRADADKAGA